MKELLKGQGLASRAKRSGILIILGSFSGQALRLISNLILTRLLVPEMFGVMALAQIFLYVLVLISDIGLRPGVIRSERGEEADFLHTAWTIQIVQGAFVCIFVLLCSLGLYVANVYHWIPDTSAYSDTHLAPVVALLALSFFISSFKSINLIIASRKLELGKLTLIDLIAQVAGIIVTVIWAYVDRTVWALVAGSFITSFLQVALSHSLFNYISARLRLEQAAVLEIVHFGKWLLISSVMTAFLNQGDRMYLGSVVSAEMVGVYSIAFFLASAAKEVISKIASGVFMSAFSEVYRERPHELKNVYYKVRLKTDLLSIFIAGFLIVSGQTIIDVLYDDRYAYAGIILQILAAGLLFTAPIISSPLMLTMGNSKYEASLRFAQTASLFILLPIFFHLWGVLGVASVLVALPFLSTFIDIWYRQRCGMLSWWRELIAFPVVLVGALLGWACTGIYRLFTL